VRRRGSGPRFPRRERGLQDVKCSRFVTVILEAHRNGGYISYVVQGAAGAEGSEGSGRERRPKVLDSVPSSADHLSTLDWKKSTNAPSVRVLVICSDHRRLWWDVDKGTDCS